MTTYSLNAPKPNVNKLGENTMKFVAEKRREIDFLKKADANVPILNSIMHKTGPGSDWKVNMKRAYEDINVTQKLDMELKLAIQGPNVNPKRYSDDYIVGSSSLIVMGCSSCYIFVMVPLGNLKCPKCHKTQFIGITGASPVKKARII